MLGKILGRLFLAGSAETNELKQVAINLKPGLLGQPLLQFTEIVTGEIDNLAAVGADYVMMVPWSTDCVAAATASGMQLTDKSQLGK